MFEDNRELAVREVVISIALKNHRPLQYYEVSIEEVKRFLKETPDSITLLELKLFDFYAKEYREGSPEYLEHSIDHSYHMEEVQKRFELVQKLLPRLNKRFLRLDEEDPGHQDQLVCLRVLGAMFFVGGEVNAISELIPE